ncbi:uncharacterized protein F5Z01DRAFT_639569 [Emericellopsis atlantica]|uniref:Uncharacterized protein n=1 Tax=Emericellopsis atlantica TaxID=2614577 RepID=A0A9P7ZFH9_9HYPO|nr:uncharacterized protein F5Z01DRAFT_639569 [Emericellopsis atlantica]KAG9251168.1 hypothetical protein F5Z01DRAFT_639569 [Emericellopsis atlantica]
MRIFAYLILFFTWAVASHIGTGTITVDVGLNATEAMGSSLAAETGILSITKVVIETSTWMQPSVEATASAPRGDSAALSLIDPGFVALSIASGIMIIGMLAVA